jgi:hypothetical protein
MIVSFPAEKMVRSILRSYEKYYVRTREYKTYKTLTVTAVGGIWGDDVKLLHVINGLFFMAGATTPVAKFSRNSKNLTVKLSNKM